MFLYLQQELMKISMTIVQFLCTADWPLCLLGRNSSPDWGGDAVQARGNHSICVYGKPEHQQQDTKHLIVVFRHELMLDVTDCAHDPSGEKPSHKKTIPQDRKKITSFLIPAERECRVSCLDLRARCEHVTTALYPVWYCLSEMKGCQVLIWAGVCVCVCSVCMHTYAKFCWIHAHIEFISPPERFPVQKESKSLSLETLIFVCFIFLNEM